MKRPSLLMLILLLSLPPLSALEVTDLHIAMGNDWYTMGVGDNLDDGLSFGSHLLISIDKRVYLTFDALGFTDKHGTGNRYDQININLTYPLHTAWGSFSTTVTPLVGVSLAGDFGFEAVQNRVHASINRPLVYLPYDRIDQTAHLSVGSTLRTMVSLGWVRLGVETSYLHSFGWENSLQGVAVMQLGSSLTLKGGYSYLDSFVDTPAHRSMTKRLTGPTLSYYFDGGLVTTSWVYHVHSGSSYGVFGIDVMQLFKPAEHDHSDFTYSIMLFHDMKGHRSHSFALGFGPVILQTRHTSGPMKDDYERPRRRMTLASWMMGFRKEWATSSPIHPYIQSMWGFQRFNLLESPTTAMIEAIKGTVALEAGIKVGKDGRWVAKSNSYHPKISAALQYVFDTKSLQREDTAFARYTRPWIVLIGFGVEIGHDPH